MNTKDKILSEARAANACEEGVESFAAFAGDNEAFAAKYPSHALWAVGHCPSFALTPERLDACAEADPWYAPT